MLLSRSRLLDEEKEKLKKMKKVGKVGTRKGSV